jgi:hypothetical protein
MSECKENGHSFLIDTGQRRLYLNVDSRAYLEKWVEAIELSCKTCIEKKHSITGTAKNISKIVFSFDLNKQDFITNLQKEFDKDLPLDKKWYAYVIIDQGRC